MTRSALSPEQYATANEFEYRTVTVDTSTVTFVLEKMVKGNAKIRVCWNSTQVTETDPNDTECLVWNYDEWVISWVPAPTFVYGGETVITMSTTTVEGVEVVDEATTMSNVADYIAVNAGEIFGYAKNACYLTKL